MRIEIAQNIVEHFHKMPFGFGRGPDNDEWKVMEKVFPMTDEEGQVLSQLMPYGEHIDDLAERLGRDKNELIPLLDSLIQKLWVGREGTKEDGHYRAISWLPGVWELQVKHYTPELLEFYRTHLISEPRTDITAEIFPWFRVVPREYAVPYNVEVLPSELLSHIIEDTGDEPIAVLDCMCRTAAKLRGESCDAPRDDICMMFGFLAQTAIEGGAGRAITKAEAMKVGKRAQDAGLVHQACTVAHNIAVCSCCPCHCGPLRALLSGFPQAMSVQSNFEPVLSMELCNGCQSCIKVCPAKAITLDRKNKKAVFDLGRCIGCGICVLSCPIENAVTLKRKEKVVTYPRTWDDFLRIRAQQTGRTEFYKEE